MINKRLKKRIFFILRLIISTVILFFIFKTQFNSFKELIGFFKNSQVNYYYVLLSFLLNWVVIYLVVLRWYFLLFTQDIKASQAFLFRSYLVGCFFNTFLPTSIGGDVYKIYDTSKLKNSSGAKAATVMIVDRFTGLISILLYLVILLSYGFIRNLNIGFVLGKWGLPDKIVFIIIAALLIFSTLIILFILFPGIFRLNKLFWKIKFLHRWEEKFRQIYNVSHRFRKYKLIIFSNIILSFILQFIFSLVYYFAGLGFGLVELKLLTIIFIVQLISILSMIPITVGGIGIREGTFVLLVGVFNGPKEIAAIVSIAILVIILIPKIIGGILYATGPAIDKLNWKPDYKIID